MYPGSDTDGGVPLIKVSDVKNGAIASRPSFCISNKVDEEYKRTRLNGSELLLTLVGNPGDCVIVTDEMCGWNVARALAVIRLKDTQLRSWIRYVLASKPAQHLIEARLNTTVQKTLNLKDVREIGIPIPPREERDSITKIIDSIEKKTLLNTQINQTLIRDDKKAYHLSEGECSLLAFCYFMAKLEDIDTKGSKPIIWIDDPISSLDSNHIFFIYSLINEKIVNNHIFGQLFISTHNLDFLKYLKKVDGKFLNSNGKPQNYQKEYFLISRVNDTSKISIMPKYLKEYVTEFNYLFHQIYKCSIIEVIDDSNYITFYNFGNNARKFLEIYLYYKYPDKGMTEETLNLFFDGDNIPALLTDRINNEYSHLCGVFERGSSPVEVPEMQIAAKRIITKLSSDREQFIGLLKSVGEDTSNISSASEV